MALPTDGPTFIKMHQAFKGSRDKLINDTVKQVTVEALQLTAALMSAEESYTVKRALFSELARDQVINGVFLTEAEVVKTIDPKTGETTSKTFVRTKRDKDGNILRKPNVLTAYGLTVKQFIIKEIDYEKNVDAQIAMKQQALMKTVAAKADAEKARQDRLTAEEVGRKNVMEAKYKKEVEKIEAVTTARKKLDVAKLDRLAAAETKQKLILLGQGEAARKRAVMIADGALDKKLRTIENINKTWADAMSKYQGNLVPLINGGSSKGGSNAFEQAMQTVVLRNIKQLNLDLTVKSGK